MARDITITNNTTVCSSNAFRAEKKTYADEKNNKANQSRHAILQLASDFTFMG